MTTPSSGFAYIRHWWDKGILWIHTDSCTCPLNAYEAQELIQLLEAERERINAQAVIDEREFGRESEVRNES